MSLVVGVACRDGLVIGADRALTHASSGAVIPGPPKLRAVGGAIVSCTGTGAVHIAGAQVTWQLLDEIERSAPETLDEADLPGLAERACESVRAHDAQAGWARPDGEPGAIVLMVWLTRWRYAHFQIAQTAGVLAASPPELLWVAPDNRGHLEMHGHAQETQALVLHGMHLSPRSMRFLGGDRTPMRRRRFEDVRDFVYDVVTTAGRVVPGVGGGCDVVLMGHGA